MSIPVTISSVRRPRLLNSTRLLISVIDPSEVDQLRNCRFPDFLDVKNPAVGSLGMPDTAAVMEIRRKTPSYVPVSVAIGDADNRPNHFASLALKAARAGADIVKVGLFDFKLKEEAVSFLSAIRGALPPAVLLVPAVYADIDKSSKPLELPYIAAESGSYAALIDTFDKENGNIINHLTARELFTFKEECDKLGLLSAIAGSLLADDVGWLDGVAPSIAGFRGAVAKGERGESGLDESKLFSLMELFGC